MKLRNGFFTLFLALTLTTLLTPVCAPAVLISLDSQAIFSSNDYVDWGNFGPVFAHVASGSSLASSVYGLKITVSNFNGSDMQRRDEGFGWDGDFASGDHLLWTHGTNGSMTIEFPVNIYGLGVQIQPDSYCHFAEIISAYDENDNLLGTFSFAAQSTNNENNTAIFSGILDSDMKIRKIVLETMVDCKIFDNFAINQLDFQFNPGASLTQAPLPGAVWLLGAGLLGLVGRRRRSRT